MKDQDIWVMFLNFIMGEEVRPFVGLMYPTSAHIRNGIEIDLVYGRDGRVNDGDRGLYLSHLSISDMDEWYSFGKDKKPLRYFLVGKSCK